ncbi:MAG: hypothetical protein Q9159_004695 [Coniocarpon cinnabarinum]
MSNALFHIKEHEVPACHIREYAGSTASRQEDVLHLHARQYIPRSPQCPPADAVTLVAAHGAALPKELYEPLWDELLQRSSQQGFTIRAIWIADTVNFGQSGVINEDKLSSDYSWMDHARDLLLFINHFRQEMPRPIVGVGHSFGGNQIVNLSFLHPRLMTSLILLDPVIQLTPPSMGLGSDPPGLINYTIHKPDVFASRKAGAEAISANPMFKKFDPRALKLMVQYGLRKLPTALHPELTDAMSQAELPVTYTSTIHQDAWTQLRPNFQSRDNAGHINIDRGTHADMDPLAASIPFYRPEPRSTWFRLPSLRPSVFWLLGERSYLAQDEIRIGIARTGTGIGGSGGKAEGRVREDYVPAHGHLFPLEAPAAAAAKCATWLGGEIARFREREAQWNHMRSERRKVDDLHVDRQWRSIIKHPAAFSRARM